MTKINWIPCSERMPEETSREIDDISHPLLLAIPRYSRKPVFGAFRRGKFYPEGYSGEFNKDVTHWAEQIEMPITEGGKS